MSPIKTLRVIGNLQESVLYKQFRALYIFIFLLVVSYKGIPFHLALLKDTVRSLTLS